MEPPHRTEASILVQAELDRKLALLDTCRPDSRLNKALQANRGGAGGVGITSARWCHPADYGVTRTPILLPSVSHTLRFGSSCKKPSKVGLESMGQGLVTTESKTMNRTNVDGLPLGCMTFSEAAQFSVTGSDGICSSHLMSHRVRRHRRTP